MNIKKEKAWIKMLLKNNEYKDALLNHFNLILLTIFLVWFWDILSQRILENVQNNSAHKEFVYFKNV